MNQNTQYNPNGISQRQTIMVGQSQGQMSPPLNSSSQVHQYPQQIINNLPPGAKITGPPLTY